MAYQMIKYKLNINGTIPSFINTDSDHGLYPNKIEGAFGPCDYWLLGIAKDRATLPNGQAELISTKADLKTYLDSYTGDWKYQNPPHLDPGIPSDIHFDQQAEADKLWAVLEALNS